MVTHGIRLPRISDRARWVQLAFGVTCMIAIANLQYGWTLFVDPIHRAHGWTKAEIQLAFAIFVALETWPTPVVGWLADLIGPKIVVATGGIMVALGWTVNASAASLTSLYLGSAIAGIGAGAIYCACIGNAVKWFPERRGLAVGLTAGGFGAGAALTVIPIGTMIATHGYQMAFLVFGLAQGALAFGLGWLVRSPDPGDVPRTPITAMQARTSVAPPIVLRTPVFWLMYAMFVLVSASGLMATAQIALVAKDYRVADVIVFMGASTLSLALIVDNVANGAARPLFGWISDTIGRENTMMIAFGLGAVAYWLLGALGTAPWAFVCFAAMIFLTWGEIFSLFPSICTDTFGLKFATANLSCLYTAKGMAAFLVPLANVVQAWAGSWQIVFVITAAMNLAVVALAFLLKPMRRRYMASC